MEGNSPATDTPTPPEPQILLAKAELQVMRAPEGKPKAQPVTTTVKGTPGLIDSSVLTEAEIAHFQSARVLFTQDQLVAAQLGGQ